VITKVLGWLIGIIVVIVIAGWLFGNPAAAGSDVHNWVTGIVSFASHAGKG
jgi:hypothetical protein